MAGSRKADAITRKIEELEKRLAEYEKQESSHDLREVTSRLEKIAEMGDDGIIVFDEDSRIEFANQMAADIFGVTKGDILHREFYQLIGKNDQEFLADMVTRGKGVGEKFCTEMAIRTERGDIKVAEVCIALTKTEDGRSRTYAYIRDITERKKYEKALKESEKSTVTSLNGCAMAFTSAPRRATSLTATRHFWTCSVTAQRKNSCKWTWLRTCT